MLPPFVVSLSNHERRTTKNQCAGTFTTFDRLSTGFDRLRANDHCSEFPQVARRPASFRYFASNRSNTSSAGFPGPLARPAATSAFSRAAAIFITSVYTHFFSAADALRMKSENGVEPTELGLRKSGMRVTLEQFLRYGYSGIRYSAPLKAWCSSDFFNSSSAASFCW